MRRVFECITLEHDLWLVALAAVVCLLGCYACFSLLHRAWRNPDRPGVWLAGAAITARNVLRPDAGPAREPGSIPETVLIAGLSSSCRPPGRQRPRRPLAWSDPVWFMPVPACVFFLSCRFFLHLRSQLDGDAVRVKPVQCDRLRVPGAASLPQRRHRVCLHASRMVQSRRRAVNPRWTAGLRLHM